MQNIAIAFFDAKPYDITSFDEVNRGFGFSIKYFKEHLTADTMFMTKGFQVVCAFVNDTLNSEVINYLYENGVQLIAMRCAGYNNVELSAAFGKMHIVRVPAYSPYAVAEHAVALMLALNRKIHKAHNRTRENNFSLNGLLGFDLHGKTVGIIGTGKIGQVLIQIMKGFGMTVLAYDLYPNLKLAETQGFQYVTLGELYERSDIISLHCPLSKETNHIINDDSIRKMKQGVIIVNTSRGGLIDTKALIAGLKSGKIGAAGLDVYEEESEYFFEDFSGTNINDDLLARLLTFNNVLVTSHQAFFTAEALHNIAETTFTNITSYYKEGKLLNEICYQCSPDHNHCRQTKEGKCF